MRRITISLFVGVSFLILSLSASPAFAQSKKELAAQNVQLQARIERLEQRMLTGDPAAERLMARIDALEGTQRNLRGELERLAYERDNLKAEVEALEGDLRAMQALSNRMQIHLDAVDLVAKEQAMRTHQSHSVGLGSGPATPLSSIPNAPTFKEQQIELPSGAMPSNDVSELGQVGKTKLMEGDYAAAQTALLQYLEFNPDAPDVGEMQYWLGESYFVRGGFADAADAYIASMRKAPQGGKAPDAMVRLAASLRELGKTAEACQVLGSFSSQYPNAGASVKSKASREAAKTGC